MSLTIKPQQDVQTPFQGVDNGMTTTQVFFTVTPSGNYTLGGDTLDFTQLGDLIKSTRPPLQVYLQSQSSSGSSGWWYTYKPGTASNNGKMQVFGTGASSGASHQELAAGPYSGTSPAITSDTIVGYAIFPRL